MSLAQLFYVKQALRRFRSSRLRTAKRRPAPRNFLAAPLNYGVCIYHDVQESE